MILELIWIMLTLTFVLLFIGYWLKIPFVAMFGWTMLFLLSLAFVNRSIEYQTGESEYYVYGNNFTGYHWDYDTGEPTNPNDYELFHVVNEYQYTDYNNNFLFVMLAIISALGFISVFFTDHLWRDNK